MESIRKKLNKACFFHDVNQWDEEMTRMMCTIYFWFINAKYNWVIPEFTEDDIKEVAKTQHDKWLFSYENWGKLSDWIFAVYDRLNEKWYDCDIEWTKNDTEAKNRLKRWYAVWLGINVDASIFYQDKLDWKLDATNYQDYKWDDGHATNIIIWTSRWTFSSESDWKEMFLDSYFTKSSTYECNIDEVLQNVDMATKYIIH